MKVSFVLGFAALCSAVFCSAASVAAAAVDPPPPPRSSAAVPLKVGSDAERAIRLGQDALDQSAATFVTLSRSRLPEEEARRLLARTVETLQNARARIARYNERLPSRLRRRIAAPFAVALDLVGATPTLAVPTTGIGGVEECVGYDRAVVWAGGDFTGDYRDPVYDQLNYVQTWAASLDYYVNEPVDDFVDNGTAVPLVDKADTAQDEAGVGGVPDSDSPCLSLPAAPSVAQVQATPPHLCGYTECVAWSSTTVPSCYNIAGIPSRIETERFGATAEGYQRSYCDPVQQLVTRVVRACLQSRAADAFRFPLPPFRSRRCLSGVYVGTVNRILLPRWYCRKYRDWRTKATMKVFVNGIRRPGPPGAISVVRTLDCP